MGDKSLGLTLPNGEKAIPRKQTIIQLYCGFSFPLYFMKINIFAIIVLLTFYCRCFGASEQAKARVLAAGERAQRFSIFDSSLSGIDISKTLSLSFLSDSLTTEGGSFVNAGQDPTGLTLFRSRFPKENLVVLAKCVRNPTDTPESGWRVTEVVIEDLTSNTPVRIWNRATGLIIPEHAKPDINARLMLNTPLPTLETSELQELMRSAAVKRAAAWYDAIVASQNELFTSMGNPIRYTSSNVWPDLSSSYDLRIPVDYKPDGSWGLVVYHGSSYGEFFPQSLREVCQNLKLLFASLNADVGYGQWHNFVLSVSLLNLLNRDFKLNPKHTLAVGMTTNAYTAALLGSLLPNRISHTLTSGSPIVPYSVGLHFRGDPEVFGGFLTSNLLEMEWLTKNDWKVYSLANSRWAYGRAISVDPESFKRDILPLWNAVEMNYELLNFASRTPEDYQDELAKMIRAILK